MHRGVSELMKQLKENMYGRCLQPHRSAEEQESFEANLDTTQEDEIIIVIRNGIIVKFEHRKIAQQCIVTEGSL